MSSDRTKQVGLWMIIYIHVYIIYLADVQEIMKPKVVN